MKRCAFVFALVGALIAVDAAAAATGDGVSQTVVRRGVLSSFFAERRKHRQESSATVAAHADATRADLCTEAQSRGDATRIFIYC